MTVVAFPAAQATAARARGAPIDPRKKLMEIPADPFSENVYRLIPGEYNPPPKDARYVSKFAKQARAEYECGVKQAASMGPPKVPLNNTSQFLKKGQGATAQTKKNDAKQLKSKNVSYLLKKDYGQNPDYNRKRQGEDARRKEEAQQLAQEAAVQAQAKALEEQGIVVMPEDERLKILEGLKANWEKLNLDYQRLSLTVDTVPKISRKVTMEQQLREYEELIDKFSSPSIHVNFNPVFE